MITDISQYRQIIENEIKAIQEFLESAGINCTRDTARQIQNNFTLEELKQPDGIYIPYYFLYLDFEEIDAQALEAGADEKGLYRAIAYVIYTARKHNERGHTRIKTADIYTFIQIIEKAHTGKTELEQNTIEQALFFITKKMRLAVEEGDFFQFSSLRNAEKTIADNINLISSYSIKDKLKKEDLTINGIELDEDQKNACLALNYPISIITGGAGTGKSTILKVICDTYENRNGGQIILAAPTGRAAQRMREATGRDAQTIHRTLDIRPYTKDNGQTIPDDSLFVLDECSMIDTFLFETVLENATRCRNIILIGDMEQLPSVGPGAVFRDILESNIIPTFRLNTIHRQNEKSLIHKNAERVKNAKKSIGFLRGDDYLFFMEYTTADCLKIIRDAYIKEAGTGHDTRIFVPIRAEKYETGTAQINLMMHYALKDDDATEYISTHSKAEDGTLYPTRIYSAGDPVIWTKNDYDLNFLNGDTGVVLSATEENLIVRINDKEVELDDKRQISECLDLAYAVTVHKSQGSTCDVAIVYLPVDSENYVEKSSLYVAITRPRERCYLIAEGESVQKALFTHTERQTGLREKLTNNNTEKRRA